MSRKRSREIGWSMTDILIWEGNKEIERLEQIVAEHNDDTTTSTSTTHTTSTTTTAPSDVRLKRNIVLTGRMLGNLSEYSWKWNDLAISLNLQNYRTIGVLAQEALEVYPEAISIGEDGYYRVDYSKII